MNAAQAQKAHHMLWFVKNGSVSDFHQLSLLMCQVQYIHGHIQQQQKAGIKARTHSLRNTYTHFENGWQLYGSFFKCAINAWIKYAPILNEQVAVMQLRWLAVQILPSAIPYFAKYSDALMIPKLITAWIMKVFLFCAFISLCDLPPINAYRLLLYIIKL